MTDRLITPEGEALARKALAQIDANPGSFNQSAWGYRTECRTVACMAGHVNMAAGATAHETLQGIYFFEGQEHHAEPLARELLGISYEHGETLFQTGNTRADLGAIVDALVAGDEAELEERYPYWDDDEDDDEDGA